MNIQNTSSQEEFLSLAEQTIADSINHAITERGLCVLGLSGGKTPEPMYTALGKHSDIDWSKVTVVLIDERYVPSDHPDSNYAMVERSLLAEGSHARKARFIAPDTTLPLETCVTTFGNALNGLTFDVVVLGMGDDGHIASLFPPMASGTLGPANAVHTTTQRFAVVDRISITMPMLQTAPEKVLLVTGNAKMEVLKKVEAGQAKELPIAMVADEKMRVIAMS